MIVKNNKVFIFGASNGFGKYIAEYLCKKKFKVFGIGKRKISSKIKLFKYSKVDIFKRESFKKIKIFLTKYDPDIVFFTLGDSIQDQEKFVEVNLLKKLFFINITFTVKILNYLIKLKKNKKCKIFVTGSTSIDNLKAKPSLVICKSALLYYVKTQKFFFDKLNFEIYYLKVGPLMHQGSYWEKIKKTNKHKFFNKKKVSKFYHPKDYFQLILKLINSKKNNSGKSFNID